MCPSATDAPAVPAPTDHSAVEHDAPPAGAYGTHGFLQPNHPGLYPRRPASRIVVNPSEKPRVVVRG